METYFGNFAPAQSRLARERVLADFRSLARDSEDLLKATAGDVSEATKEIRTRLAEALARANRTYNDLQEQTLAAAKTAAAKADTAIRSHPRGSLGLAFGLGLVFGALVARGGRVPPRLVNHRADGAHAA
ncbi:MAG: DUF883 family protein [Verrucomicrobia bacterium]|nr:DUF883 family protein [Verrucomicrobiota bacterium]